MKLKDTLIALSILMGVGILLYVWLSPGGSRQAPDIHFTSMDKQEISIKALRGKPILVNFWATTCTTCMKEIPELARLYRDLNHKGLEVIGVSMYYDPPSQVVEMVKLRDIPYPIVNDVQKQLMHAFRMQRAITPTTYLISPEGKIVFQRAGLLDMQQLRAQIESMLKSS